MSAFDASSDDTPDSTRSTLDTSSSCSVLSVFDSLRDATSDSALSIRLIRLSCTAFSVDMTCSVVPEASVTVRMTLPLSSTDTLADGDTPGTPRAGCPVSTPSMTHVPRSDISSPRTDATANDSEESATTPLSITRSRSTRVFVPSSWMASI